ncbi:MAG TPA: carboxypeptidase regulatory-like domain-containing protein [bacterium (Candidatus Stahlbacteria)]|nr:carboxypeptidase regulatory-like domain-containing protein [Candidatus Stahlbacteria bacterium]
MSKNLYWGLLILLLLSCTPPRDNPLDPNSPYFQGKGTISGRVTDYAGNPLSQALIFTIPQKYATETDSLGFFLLEPDSGNWQVVANYNGYAPDTIEVYLSPGGKETISFYLNGIPFFTEAKVVSYHEDRGWPIGSIYYAFVRCIVSDPDGIADIDSAHFEVPSIGIHQALLYVDGAYEGEISTSSCPNGTLEDLIGYDFIAYAIDKKGEKGKSDPFYLARIIYPLPYPIWPTYKDTVSSDSSFSLIWRGIDVNYPFLYKAVICKLVSFEPIRMDSIAPPDTQLIVDSLPEGTYLWQVMGIDEFGNVTKSQYSMFMVK